ncbi:MAG: hypothetical protein H0U27_10235 [Nitrosopumilus sp.]|nr:hypothetical protein [Nitrosopumilus sp.]
MMPLPRPDTSENPSRRTGAVGWREDCSGSGHTGKQGNTVCLLIISVVNLYLCSN